MNNCQLIGHLTRDPELRMTNTGKAVANFTLAVNRAYSKDKEADFFRVVVWGKQAENVASYLKKGSQCAVSGSIHNNNYEDRDGNMRYSVDINADRVEFLSGYGNQTPDEPTPFDDKTDVAQYVPSEDVPF